MSQPPSYPGPGESQPNTPGGQSGQPGQPGSTPPGGQNYGNPAGGQPGSTPPGQSYGSGNNYGTPPPNQYGGWQGGNDPTEKNSGIAIAALITGFGCCLGWIGIILGIIGIRKTGPGKAKGRWMAVTGIVAGTVMTLVFAGLGFAIFVLAKDTVTPENAKAGECMNVEKDGEDVRMTRKDCSEDHDAQIYEVGSLSFDDAEALKDSRFGEVQTCLNGLESIDGDVSIASGGELGGTSVRVGVPVVEDNKNFDDGDKVICYVEATSGKLNGDYVNE